VAAATGPGRLSNPHDDVGILSRDSPPATGLAGLRVPDREGRTVVPSRLSLESSLSQCGPGQSPGAVRDGHWHGLSDQASSNESSSGSEVIQVQVPK
jgi:hypothetical protein